MSSREEHGLFSRTEAGNRAYVYSESEREQAFRLFVIVKNKLMSVCNASVLLLGTLRIYDGDREDDV